jgi:hypothetical protein
MQPGGDTDHPEVSQAITDAVELHHYLGGYGEMDVIPVFVALDPHLCRYAIYSYYIDLIFIIRIL